MYYENQCSSSYYSSASVVEVLSNGITFEIIESSLGISGGYSYPYGNNSGQIILPVGANGIMTFSHNIYGCSLKMKVIGYYP